jgi:pyruvate ferredoxin oxidoreductase gamma subunit
VYRIRLHGRGGQGVKTAARILGTAFFESGFEVQDAPRYGAERRGAPIFAYVRAARQPIHERGVIIHPDLVLVADDTLIAVPGAGVLEGLAAETWLVVATYEDAAIWRTRIQHPGPLITLAPPATQGGITQSGPLCAGAAARLLGVIGREILAHATALELAEYGTAATVAGTAAALRGFDELAAYAGAIRERAVALAVAPPAWVDVPLDAAAVAAPAIHATHTSVEVRTGLWRTLRPVIDHARCNRCNWVCSTFCPDNAIEVDAEGYPHIDLDHCKGCMICVAQCPPHAISAIPERDAVAQDRAAAGAS